MKITLLSSKGQITIPKDMQELLKITHKSKIALYPQKDMIIVKPLRTSIVEQTAGSLKNYIPKQKRNIPFRQVLTETQRLAAKAIVENK